MSYLTKILCSCTSRTILKIKYRGNKHLWALWVLLSSLCTDVEWKSDIIGRHLQVEGFLCVDGCNSTSAAPTVTPRSLVFTPLKNKRSSSSHLKSRAQLWREGTAPVISASVLLLFPGPDGEKEGQQALAVSLPLSPDID